MKVLMAVTLSLGLLFVEGCEDEARVEREIIRQEINTITVKVTNSNGSIS